MQKCKKLHPIWGVISPKTCCQNRKITSENCKEGWIGTVAFKRLLGPTIELEIAVDEVENLLRLSIPRREGENLNVGKQVNVSLTDKKNLVVIPHKVEL